MELLAIAELGMPFATAGFGALFGAHAASRLAKYSEMRRELDEKFSAVSVSASISSLICNDALSWKSQHIQSVYDEYFATRNEIILARKSVLKPQSIHVNFNFITLPNSQFASDGLFDLVKNKVSDARLLNQTKALVSCCENFERLLAERNSLGERISSVHNEVEKINQYFGFMADGRLEDTRYLDCIRNLLQSIDDIIVHSLILNKKFTLRAIDLQEMRQKSFGFRDHNIFFADLSSDPRSKYIPDMANYSIWFEEPVFGRRKWYETRKSHRRKLRSAVGLDELRNTGSRVED